LPAGSREVTQQRLTS